MVLSADKKEVLTDILTTTIGDYPRIQDEEEHEGPKRMLKAQEKRPAARN